MTHHLKMQEYHWDAINCCGCKGCIWVDHVYCSGIKYGIRCPSLYTYEFDTYSAVGRTKLALGLMDGTFEFTPRAVEIIYKCSLCMACDVGCKRNLDLDPGMVLETMRIAAVERGAGPPEALRKVAENVLSRGNRYGGAPENTRQSRPTSPPRRPWAWPR